MIPPGLPLTNFYQERRFMLIIRGHEVGGARENILIQGTDHFEITGDSRVTEKITGGILGSSRALPIGGRY